MADILLYRPQQVEYHYSESETEYFGSGSDNESDFQGNALINDAEKGFQGKMLNIYRVWLDNGHWPAILELE